MNMKRVLFLICVLSLVANTVLAQERPEMRRENRRNTETTERQIPPGHPERVDGQNPNAEKQPMTFMQSLKLRTDVGNPQFEAGHMMIKSSRFKTASLACAAVSGGIWFFNNSEDYEVEPVSFLERLLSFCMLQVCVMNGWQVNT